MSLVTNFFSSSAPVAADKPVVETNKPVVETKKSKEAPVEKKTAGVMARTKDALTVAYAGVSAKAVACKDAVTPYMTKRSLVIGISAVATAALGVFAYKASQPQESWLCANTWAC